MKITNTQKGPRGINTVGGPVLVEVGATIEAEVYAREKQHVEATGWFEINGDYTANPSDDTPAGKAAASDTSKELDELKRQLAEKDAELAKLKGGGSERDELKRRADELSLQYPGNISNVKLKELIDAKLAE